MVWSVQTGEQCCGALFRGIEERGEAALLAGRTNPGRCNPKGGRAVLQPQGGASLAYACAGEKAMVAGSNCGGRKRACGRVLH
jgi:hypothetical protein